MYKKAKKQVVSNQYFDPLNVLERSIPESLAVWPLSSHTPTQAVCCRIHARYFGKHTLQEHA